MSTTDLDNNALVESWEIGSRRSRAAPSANAGTRIAALLHATRSKWGGGAGWQFARQALAALVQWQTIFLVTDLVALAAGFLCASILSVGTDPFFLNHDSFATLKRIAAAQLLQYSALGTFVLLQFERAGHYHRHHVRLPYWIEVRKIAETLGLAMLVDGFLRLEAKEGLFASGWIFAGAGILAFRASVRALALRYGAWRVPAVLVGTGALADVVCEVLRSESRMGYEIVAQVAVPTAAPGSTSHSWRTLCASHGASHVVLAVNCEALGGVLAQLARESVPFIIAPSPHNLPVSGLTPLYFLGHDLVLLAHTSGLDRPLPRFLKRFFDVVLSAAALLLFGPTLVLAALAVKLDGGPALYGHRRLGMNGRTFTCLKFRSMIVDHESAFQKYLAENPEARSEWECNRKLRNDPRVTQIGAFLRRTSLDELPQLINVLKGDMSIVGPRPIVAPETEKYSDDISHYYRVRPGITGLWQVSGRSDVSSYGQRVSMDSWYVRNWSLWHDLVITCKTFPAVLKRRGAY